MLLARLVESGILRREDDRFMWVFHERRYPIIDNKAVQEVKLRIMGVLFSDEIPDVRDIGSDSEKGADFTAIMYSVVSTLSMHGIDVLRWLEAWLTACAENGRKPPDDLLLSLRGLMSGFKPGLVP